MGVKATPQSAAAAWQTGFSGAGTKYKAGIDSVQVAPGQQAAARKNAYVQGVTQNADIWAAHTAAVSLPDWKNAAGTIGVQNLATGAQKGAPKVANFQAKFLPTLTSIVNGLPARGDFGANMARFQSYATALHQAKGSFK